MNLASMFNNYDIDKISYFFCIVSIGPVSNSNELDIFGLDAEAKEEAYGVRFLAGL